MYHAKSATRPMEPLSALNITPLIDVMLVLLVMFILAVPLATHSLDIPLPNGPAPFESRAVNIVTIDAQDRLAWNGQRLDRQALLNQLASVRESQPEAELRFDPDARASYDASAKTIALIKDSGISRFAFVGNERYRQF